MAIIYSYPSKSSVASGDLFVISDASDNNKTKQVTAQDIADFVDGEVTLQEVLQTGSSATGNTGNSWAGNMQLTQGGNIVSPQIARRFIVDVNGLTGSGTNKTAYLVGDLEIAGNGASDAGDLNMSGSFEVVGNGTIAGNLNMSEATSDIIFSGGTITSTSGFGVGIRPSAGQNIELDTGAGGNITLTGSGTADLIANMGGIIDITSTGNATFSTGTKDYLIADATSGSTTLEGKSTFIYSRGATGSVISIGGTISSTRPDSIMSQAENIFQVKTTTGSSRFYMHGGSGVDTPGINSVSPHSFYDEIRLGGTAATFNDGDGSVLTPGVQGTAGTLGQLLSSGGAGASARWIDSSTLSVGRIIEDVQFSSAVIKGTAVYISGPAHGSGRPTVDIADADGASTKMPVIGLALEDYAAGQGEVIVTGVLEDIDLTTHGTFSVGDVLYIKDQGGSPLNTNLQNTKPIGDAKIQNIGIVAKPGANGSIQVSCIGRTNDLPNNNANTLFSANASGFPVSTIGKLEVDVANDTIKIGEQALTTDVTITSDNFRAEVTNNTAAGFNNFVIGQGALNQAFVNGGTGLNNTALGINAMSGNLASGAMSSNYNVAVGQGALASGTGLSGFLTNNTAIGYFAMRGGSGGAGPTTFNTAVGSNALQNINSNAIPSAADLNTAIGSSALFNLTSGEENTSLGSSSGTGVTTGDYNTFIGAQTNTSAGNIQYGTTIGYNADVLADGGVALGANSVVTGVGGVALGARAIAAASRLNIKVDNVAGPNPQGGLPNFPDRAAALAAGLTPGDVYCATPGGPDNPGTSFLLAII